ncbi:MAG TPA: VWA domain-containing protein [Terrimicrobiaceae bacterium]|nr:VWA domain-containing protein [Terrimicrobiaceae bacterium]
MRFEDRADNEKLLHYEVGVRAAEDTLSENNQTGAAVVSEGASRVLLLTDRPESARYLEWALRQEGVELSVRPAEGAPAQMSDIQNFDAIILDNIPASALSRVQMELFRSYVSDFGGGLLMLGGDQAYGLGGYFRTPVEDVLPVRCDFQKEEENPSLALALVIDRSGSMSGENLELAKAAAKSSSDLLGPRDYVSVIAFDHESHPVVPIQPAENHAAVASEIASITAGGGTNIAPAMEEALRQLAGNAAKLKHVILLTDGVSQEGPFYELATQMAQNNITVSTVAVGSGADTELLSQIAQWGNGRYYETNDPTTIPQIFTKETMTAAKSAIQEFPFLAKPVRAVDFLEGVPWETTPFLLGYVRTKAKPTSETWLVTERGDPLLTTWRFGLGTTAAFTSDARNRWAVEWLRWNGFGKFWAQLLRRISRPAAMGYTEAEIRERDGTATITVNALDETLAFPENTSCTVRIADPDGKADTIFLEKILPGRWEGSFPAAGRGIYSAQVVLERDGRPTDSRFLTLSQGYSPEHLLDPVNTTFLSGIAAATGGTVSPDPRTAFLQNDRTAPIEQELWPWLALLALAGFVLDVGIRRWPDSN